MEKKVMIQFTNFLNEELTDFANLAESLYDVSEYYSSMIDRVHGVTLFIIDLGLPSSKVMALHADFLKKAVQIHHNSEKI